MEKKQQWYSHGKLLLSGEYLVMEGAKSFALPLRLGQSLLVKNTDSKDVLAWIAHHQNSRWFKAVFEMQNFDILETDNRNLAKYLAKILRAVRQLSNSYLTDGKGLTVETKLDFNPEFGFGSSSTLISNLAWWADVSPFELLRLTFGGSGYDLACARINTPLFYQLTDNGPRIEEISFSPVFKNQIYFVYLGQKQKSTDSIQSFRKSAVFGESEIQSISQISQQLVISKSLQEFEDLLNAHEKIMAKILGRQTVKSQLFKDYEGTVKSLGGWGGDFVLVTSHQADSDFRTDMKNRGFSVVFSFDELVL